MKAFGLSICTLIMALPVWACEKAFPLPETPAAVTDIVYARPFTLERGFRYDWSAEHPTVSAGTLVVLIVDTCLVHPRDAAEPVLYAGGQTAQRLNSGHESGFVIALVPGEVDLARTPIWFGNPELPERVSVQTIRQQRALADEAGIRPFAEERIKGVMQDPLEASDLAALLRDHVSDLVLEYSPQEKELAEIWRLHRVKETP